MRCSGIDLAANPAATGLAMLRTHQDTVTVESVTVGVTDEDIVQAIQASHRTGIDVPFGWPQPFVDFVSDHAGHRLTAPGSTDGPWRRQLAMRATDLAVHRATGLTPLSVAANLIAYPAFRWAGIAARLAASGVDVSRDGSGAVAEVYPAAALYRWGLPHTQYKGRQRQAVRQQLITGLADVLALDWNGFAPLALADDNALDAVIAALVSHLIAQGRCDGPAPENRQLAAIEGWIWLPTAISDGPAPRS